jgi:hypothetical protein
LYAAALPLDEHRAGVVAKVAGLVREDSMHQPAHRLRWRVFGGPLPGYKMGEAALPKNSRRTSGHR